MNKYENFRVGLLKKVAPISNYGHALHAITHGLAAEFDIPEPHVREQLLKLAAEQLISLTAWDGLRERPYNEWPDADSFFKEFVRIRVLSAGGELLATLPQLPIGFASASK